MNSLAKKTNTIANSMTAYLHLLVYSKIVFSLLIYILNILAVYLPEIVYIIRAIVQA